MKKTYHGSCHCGAVRYEADIDLAAGAGKCNCSICTKTRGWGAIVKPADFRLLAGEDALGDYQFGSLSAHHHFCRHCGVHPFYVPRSDPDKIDVNVRCLDGIDLASLSVKEFDGRHWEDAMQRRVPWR